MASTPSALTKSTIIQNTFTNIYDRLADNVTSVTITGAAVITIQTYTNSFNEKMISEKDNYPILIVNSPTIEREIDWTLTKKKAFCSFTVDILTTQKEAADKFLDAIKESIETYRDNLRNPGDMLVVNFRDTDTDDSQKGAFMVHMRSGTFTFEFIYTKTRTY